MTAQHILHSVYDKIAAHKLVPESIAVIDKLIEAGQAHLFQDWDEDGSPNDEQKIQFLDKLAEFDQAYPGGITGYAAKVGELLRANDNSPFDGVKISQAPMVDLTRFDSLYEDAERAGLERAGRIAFVLVAGGLGERLGYSGIKMEIPFEVTSGTTYMQYYCETIRALQQRANKRNLGQKVRIPFVIMASDGTRARMKAYLEANTYFGLSPEQVMIFEQSQVPAVADAQGRFAKSATYRLNFKPYGHGDVHALLHRHGIARRLHGEGKTHIIFIQDTNAAIVNVMMPALGTSLIEKYDFNMVCVPRVPQEAIGAVVSLQAEGMAQTVNVEYNLLDNLLRDSGGDNAMPGSSFSPFPGNINLLIARLDPYLKTLESTQGTIAEFINPKFADEAKTCFQKPVRLETLMQDVAKSFPTDVHIGGSLFDREWALSPLKNNIRTALDKARQGQPPYAAATAESGFYQSGRRRLRQAGMDVEQAETVAWGGIPIENGCRVVLAPDFAMTLEDVRQRISGGFLGKHSSLVLRGEDIRLENVRLLGRSALVIEACEGASVHVKDLLLEEDGYLFTEVPGNVQVPEWTAMRGYERKDVKPSVYKINEPGYYRIDKDGVCRKQ